jgi:competence protein ComEA
MKKIFFFMVISVSFLFSAINLQTASKKELMCIKGIGEKKANAILEYRKKNKIKSADDLIDIKGFGKVLIENVKKDVKSVACGGKKTNTKTTKKKNTASKKTTKKEDLGKKKIEKKSKDDATKKDSKKSKEKVKKEQLSKKTTTNKSKEKSNKKETKEKKEK